MIKISMTLILAAAAAGFACGSSDGPAAQSAPAPGSAPAPVAAAVDRGPVAARVNGVPIYKVDLDMAVQNFMQSNGLGPDTPEDRRQEAVKSVLDGMIGSELLFQKAQSIPIEIAQADLDQRMTQTREGMGAEGLKAELEKRRMGEKDLERLMRVNLTIEKMIRETIIDTTVVSDEEMKKFYDEHLDQMKEPEYVEASHILVKSGAGDPPEQKQAARGKIDALLGRLKGGENFEALAREQSDDRASAERGGALGTVHRGQTVPVFEEVAFKLQPGQTSDVVESDFGFHIIKVTGKQAAGTAPFDRAREKIAEFLKRQRSQQSIESLVESLRASAKIEVL